VAVRLEKNVLVVSGARSKQPPAESSRLIRSERRCGAFRRAFRLHAGIEAGEIVATMKNGLLDIILPKREEAKPQKISIAIEEGGQS
ncbi:Hsp20/alpha crystallin family protein, partial [bacterium]|nr:Hsp20/alpha crystallin family protein [candidate division CSSED10-310 bacterium]